MGDIAVFNDVVFPFEALQTLLGSGGERLDLRALLTVTIDPASARDFDDAISLQRDDRGYWSLGVHIADVYLTENSPELMLLTEHHLLAKLPASITSQIPAQYDSPTGPAEKFPRKDWDATLAANLTAPMVLSQ